MITLPMSCRQLMWTLYGLGWVGVSIPLFFWPIDMILPTWMLFITYGVISVWIAILEYYDKQPFPIRCKCDEE